MNGQFKSENFDKRYFKEFVDELKKKGTPLTITWKKGNKKVEETHEKANVFSLETEGKWFFRIIKDKGHVRFKNLNAVQERKVLGVAEKISFLQRSKLEFGSWTNHTLCDYRVFYKLGTAN